MNGHRAERLRLRWNRARRKVLAALLAALAIAAAGEAYFRATEPNGASVWRRLFVASRDPEISRLMRPNARLTYTGTLARLPDTTVATNADGFRGRPFADADASRGPRIVALGASLVFGEGLTDDATIPARIEARFRADHPACDARAFNLGIPGIDLAAMVRLLELHGPRLRPDLLVVAAWPEAVRPELPATAADAIGGAAYYLVAASRLAAGRAAGRGLFIALQSGLPRLRSWFGLSERAAAADVDAYARIIKPAFDRLAGLADKWNTRVVVLLFCTGVPEYGSRAPREAFLAATRAMSWDVVDVDSRFDPNDPTLRISRWDVHPSAKSCRILANAVCATSAAHAAARATGCDVGDPPR
jgi:hypothetical protein